MHTRSVYTFIGDVFEQFGGAPLSLIGLPSAFTIDTRADVQRYFLPHIVFKRGGYQVLGSVGVYVPAFEHDWEAAAKACNVNDPLLMRPLLSAFITNHPALVSPPVCKDMDEGCLSPWIQAIIGVMTELPDDLQQLVRGISRGLFGPFKLRPSQGHVIKWSAFVAWVRSNTSSQLDGGNVILDEVPDEWRRLHDMFHVHDGRK